jgi:lipoprotein-anchoring transpeptidase ErfK/SrfK
MRFRLAMLGVALALGGCNFKGTPDPQLSARDLEWMALVPKGEADPIYARYQKAMRYGVAVGNEAFGWTGTARIARKSEWPSWNPPAEMKKRWPHVHAMDGGPMNPLGARALYLYEGNRDTLYRIHGTNEEEKIGHAVSSGCIRMRNIDVVDLFNRAEVGAKVIVR